MFLSAAVIPRLRDRAALPADALLSGRQSSAMNDKDALVAARRRGDSLKALDPVRIRRDRVKVAVVLSETPDDESGIYVVRPASPRRLGSVSSERRLRRRPFFAACAPRCCGSLRSPSARAAAGRQKSSSSAAQR
ncbi:hypothetical protein [Tahibacter caeni]|uniref:hypothetical protein n=1 Tax=Tahibacter caeni TaxID=1453545 RepID=UPI002148C9B1|nr:hypothetical protein [Tahibacter caeni]